MEKPAGLGFALTEGCGRCGQVNIAFGCAPVAPMAVLGMDVDHEHKSLAIGVVVGTMHIGREADTFTPRCVEFLALFPIPLQTYVVLVGGECEVAQLFTKGGERSRVTAMQAEVGAQLFRRQPGPVFGQHQWIMRAGIRLADPFAQMIECCAVSFVHVRHFRPDMLPDQGRG